MKATRSASKQRILRGLTGGGVSEPPAVVSTATPVLQNLQSILAESTMRVVGVDSAPFSFLITAIPTTPILFPNLPKRDNTANPLRFSQVEQRPLNVAAKDFLLFVTFVQGLVAPAGVGVSASPLAVTQNGSLTVPGPFLGSNAFRSFQAQLNVNGSASAGQVSGSVVGMLFTCIG